MIPEHYSFISHVNPGRGRGEITVLFSGEGRPVGGHRVGPAVHSYYLIHTAAAGKGIYEINGKPYKCSKGDSFVIFPGELFSYEADSQEPWHYVWVAFRGHLSGVLLQQLGITPERPVIPGSGTRKTLALYRRLLRALQQTEWPPLADLEAAGILRLLLHEFGLSNQAVLPFKQTQATAAERQVNQAVRWLSLQYAQPVSIDQLARSLGYHRTHLSKIFKQQIGLSPMQFLMQIRLEQAKTLLESHWTVEQVASSVGFADALYFSKQFRKRFGLSPTEYRSRG
jgi:AraC-like DNA-binding protein